MSEANKDVVRRIFEEAFNRNDPALAEALVHPEFVDHNPIAGQPQGRAAARFITDYLSQRAGGRGAGIRVVDVFGEGERVAVRWTAGAPGKPPSVEAIVLFRVKDGLIAERWAAFNRP